MVWVVHQVQIGTSTSTSGEIPKGPSLCCFVASSHARVRIEFLICDQNFWRRNGKARMRKYCVSPGFGKTFLSRQSYEIAAILAHKCINVHESLRRAYLINIMANVGNWRFALVCEKRAKGWGLASPTSSFTARALA